MKKILALVLALCMVFALCACGSDSATTAATVEAATEAVNEAAAAVEEAMATEAPAEEAAATEAPMAEEAAATEAPMAEAQSIKFGLITLHDENSTYDANFINAANQMVEDLAAENIAVDLVIKTGISEGQDCYETACDLADQGCNVIFADSFGHEDFMIQAAQDYPEVEFLHATGYQAASKGLANFHDAFASIYEGRYLAGVAAGLKLQAMLDSGEATEAKVGYVGAYPYAEVMSGFTSWFLGVRSVVPDVTMEVTYTNSWYDETAEKEGANALIADGCVLISQHADSMGAPTACETAGVPDVTYNVSTEEACPNTYLAGSKINWAPYMEYAIKCVLNGEAIDTDWVGTIATGSVELLDLGTAAVEGTADKLAEVQAQLESGDLHVFDCSTFTVDGKELTSEDDANIVDGYYAESGVVSAPSFAYLIDGITLLG